MIFVLLPAYNEERGLPSVVEKFDAELRRLGRPHRFVVVDDGSRDRTADVARELSTRYDLTLIQFPQNRGIQEGFRALIRHAVEHGADDDLAVILDADGTQDASVLGALISAAETRADVAIASRFRKGGGMRGVPFHRSVLSHGARYTMCLRFRVPGVRDYSCFYRAYRISALRRGLARFGDALIQGKGFSAAAGLIVRLHTAGVTFTEVPLVLDYGAKAGLSGMRLPETLRGYAGLVFRRGPPPSDGAPGPRP